MKTLGKLKINPEKVLNNDALLALRGGTGPQWGDSCIYCYDWGQGLLGHVCANLTTCVWPESLVGNEEARQACCVKYPDTDTVAGNCGGGCVGSCLY